ncbi:hypothetical protein IAD21_06376 [Abditibacteriota bacterium]|nr:hypothetical protein IAD21_06376 [Abditibacteriota bacterium]
MRWIPLVLLLSWILSGCQSRPSEPVWNVPELVGKPIDAVKHKIGTPQSETNLDGNVKQSTWQHEDTTLVANWKTTNKRVTNWTLVSRDESHALREEERDQLLQPGQLKENAPAYTTEWIEAEQRPLFYTGVRVIPAVKNHAVTLRLTGAAAVVQISYTLTGAQGKSDTFVTFAPWEESFTLPDDAQISLTAALQKTLVAGQSDLKIEILSDGKVVATATSSGGLIRCQAEL